MSSTKTIIITALPNVLGQSPAFRKTIVPGGPGGGGGGGGNRSLLGKPTEIQIKREFTSDQNEETSATRKRQRLDHLSLDEKLLRRKLKNRVAAQTARDRKKAKMDDLEDLVQQFEIERNLLKADNSKLKNMNMLLETENVYLKDKIAKLEDDNKVIDDEREEKKSSDEVVSFEHAEGTGSQPEAADASFSIDQALSMFSNDNESNDILELYQQFTQDLLGWEFDKLPSKDDHQKEDARVSLVTKEPGSSLVGPTPEELESFKELIHFDHIYYKEPKKSGIVQQSIKESDLNTNKDVTQVESAMEVIVESSVAYSHKICIDNNNNNNTEDKHTFMNSPYSTTSESGYDSAKSPFSEPESLLDEQDWEESFSELFPTLI